PAPGSRRPPADGVPPVPDGQPVDPAGRAGTATGSPGAAAAGSQDSGDGQPAVRAAVQGHTLRVLTTSQVLGGVAVSSGIVVGGLLAADLAGSEAYAGVAQTCAALGAALLAVPGSRLMARPRPRPGPGPAAGPAWSRRTASVRRARSWPCWPARAVRWGCCWSPCWRSAPARPPTCRPGTPPRTWRPTAPVAGRWPPWCGPPRSAPCWGRIW